MKNKQDPKPPFAQVAAFGQPVYGPGGSINGIVNIADKMHVVDESGTALGAAISKMLPLVVILRFPDFDPQAPARSGTISIVHRPAVGFSPLPTQTLKGAVAIGVKFAFEYKSIVVGFGQNLFDIHFDEEFVTRVSLNIVREASKDAAVAAVAGAEK